MTMVSFPTTIAAICEKAAQLPVDRHWISDDSAYEYIRQRLLGKTIIFRDPYKQRLYLSLYNVFCEMRDSGRYNNMPLREVVAIALMRPAPCVGVNPRTIQRTLHKILKRK